MPDRKLRAGVIGCGVGRGHAWAYLKNPDLFDLVAICDLKPEVFETFYNTPDFGNPTARGVVREYTDHREMLAKENLDVVSIATPDHLHIGPVIDAAEAKVKCILVEKPIATRIEDADKMIEAANRNGVRLSVDHTRSWWPSYAHARKLVREGAIGGLTRIVVTMGGARAMLFRNGTHMVDTMEYFAESRPVWVIAAHDRGYENYGLEYKGEGGRDPSKDPATTMIVEFENGVRGIFNGAKKTPELYEVELLGPSGRIILGESVGRFYQSKEREGEPFEQPFAWPKPHANRSAPNLVFAMQEMAEIVRRDAPSSSPAERARNSLEIMFGALLSQSRDSAKVHLPLPRPMPRS